MTITVKADGFCPIVEWLIVFEHIASKCQVAAEANWPQKPRRPISDVLAFAQLF